MPEHPRSDAGDANPSLGSVLLGKTFWAKDWVGRVGWLSYVELVGFLVGWLVGWIVDRLLDFLLTVFHMTFSGLRLFEETRGLVFSNGFPNDVQTVCQPEVQAFFA